MIAPAISVINANHRLILSFVVSVGFISFRVYFTSNFGEISTVPFSRFLAFTPIESFPSLTEKDGEILTLFVLVRVFCFRTFVGSCLAITDITISKHSAIQDIFSRVFSGLLCKTWNTQGEHHDDAEDELSHENLIFGYALGNNS